MNTKGLVLINLGSPDSFQVGDVKKYLRQFLMDERVIDTPSWVRKIIVEGFVLPFRPAKSARAYEAVWTQKGAPLKVLTQDFMHALEPLVKMPVAMAMRYGNPEPEIALHEIESRVGNLRELYIAPLYPHYAMSSYETAWLYVKNEIQKKRPDLSFRILQPFYDEAEYVRTLAESIRPYLRESFDKLLFSYHGLPVRHLMKTDPTGNHCYADDHCCAVTSVAWSSCYRHQVIRTTQRTASALGLGETQYGYSFQSRLGRDEWIKPFTFERLENYPNEGVRKLLVVCPAFVADCLETLEEIAIRGKEVFLNAGGETFQLIPCLNSSRAWVETFARYCNEADDQYKLQWKAEIE